MTTRQVQGMSQNPPFFVLGFADGMWTRRDGCGHGRSRRAVAGRRQPRALSGEAVAGRGAPDGLPRRGRVRDGAGRASGGRRRGEAAALSWAAGRYDVPLVARRELFAEAQRYGAPLTGHRVDAPARRFRAPCLRSPRRTSTYTTWGSRSRTTCGCRPTAACQDPRARQSARDPRAALPTKGHGDHFSTIRPGVWSAWRASVIPFSGTGDAGGGACWY